MDSTELEHKFPMPTQLYYTNHWLTIGSVLIRLYVSVYLYKNTNRWRFTILDPTLISDLVKGSVKIHFQFTELIICNSISIKVKIPGSILALNVVISPAYLPGTILVLCDRQSSHRSSYHYVILFFFSLDLWFLPDKVLKLVPNNSIHGYAAVRNTNILDYVFSFRDYPGSTLILIFDLVLWRK